MKGYCANCHKKTHRICDGCKTIRYCSIECLQEDYKKHRKRCKEIRKERCKERCNAIMKAHYEKIVFSIYMSYIKNNECDRLISLCKSSFINKQIIPSPSISDFIKQCKRCYVCNKTTAFICSRCYEMPYCSILCQRTHYKKHKMYCRAYTDADKYYEAFVYVINKTYSRGHYNECYKWMRLGLKKSKPIKTVSKVFGAIMYFYGQGVEKEYNTTYNIVINSCIYESKIHPKLSDVIYELSVIYLKSAHSITKLRGVQLLEISTKTQNINAYARLGYMYVNGINVEQNFKKGFILTKLAADQGNQNAQYSLGAVYYAIDGTARDLPEAMRLWKLAADQGHQDAQHMLGCMYYDGEGVTQDLQESMRLFELSAIQGHKDAQYSLGDMYCNGKGVEVDLSEAMRLWKLSATQGNQDAQYELGWMYYDGEGVEVDLSEALRLFELSAIQGHKDAQCSLGDMYYFGKGVTRDFQEAMRLWKLSAAQGNKTAQTNIAISVRIDVN
jgi:TPR repeat protein